MRRFGEITEVSVIGLFDIRERRPGYHIDIIPITNGCMGEGANKLREQIARVLETDEK